MASTNKRPQVKDKGGHIEYSGKSLRLRNGARLLADSPEYFTHFTEFAFGAFTVTGPLDPAGPLTYTSTGTAVTNPTIGGLGGILTLTTDNIQNTAEELSTNLAFQIDTNAPLVFEAKLKVSEVGVDNAALEAFFGLADATTYTSGRPYTVTTASAVTGTNVPADFAGFAISSVPTSGVLFNTAITGTTDGTNVGILTSIASVDAVVAATFADGGVFATGFGAALGLATTGRVNNVDSYHVYRIEVDAAGTAKFFVDGMFCGSKQGLTVTVPLGAYFDIVNLQGSAANTEAGMFIDYIYVGGSSA